MTDFNIRRRLIEDGASEYEAEEALMELAERANDDARDREGEKE